MSGKQIMYDILDHITSEIGTVAEIQNRIEMQDHRKYTAQEIKDELLLMGALGLVETEVGFGASEKGQDLYDKLYKEDPKKFKPSPVATQ
jgi:hypothetical protein